jgi:hypothetical protein
MGFVQNAPNRLRVREISKTRNVLGDMGRSSRWIFPEIL